MCQNFSDEIQLISFIISLNNIKTAIHGIYRAPENSTSHLSNFEQCLNFITEYSNCCENTVCIGDFNTPDINWGSGEVGRKPISQLLLHFAHSNDLFQLIQQATHIKGNILDLIFSNDLNLIHDISIKAPFKNSDHHTIYFTLNIENKIAPASNRYLDFRKANWVKINYELARIDWSILSYMDIDQQYTCIIDACGDLIDTFIPLKTFEPKIDYPKSILKLQSKLNNIQPSPQNAIKLAKLRRRLDKLILLYRLKIEKKLSSKKNLSMLYRYANKKLTENKTIGQLLVNDGIITEEADKCDAFAKHFQSIYGNRCEEPNYTLESRTSSILNYIDISPLSVIQCLKRLPLKGGTSPDSIPYYFLKKTAEFICVPLTRFFNNVQLQGRIPKLWRIGFVKPIFKKGSPNKVDNYRPISLTCCLSKVMERILCCEIKKFLTSNHLLSPNQHGFLAKRSCVSALLSTIPLWQKLVNQNKSIFTCYLDFQKAFDTVPIPLLLLKLRSYGIQGCLYRLLESFLNGRSQKVMINKNFSYEYNTKTGVPQGSCIGPLLFLIYINDIFDDMPTGVHCSLYADDSKLSVVEEPTLLQLALDKVSEWSARWKLSLCEKKCVVLNINPKIGQRVFTLGGVPLKNVKEVTDLGITYTNKLSFHPYIESKVRIAKARCNYILRAFASTDPIFLFKIFTVYVRPILEYATVIWSPLDKKHIQKVESVQKQYTYRIFQRAKTRYFNYKNRLRILKADSLQTRRDQMDLTTLHNIMHEKVNVSSNDLFEFSLSIGRTRRHRFAIRPIIASKLSFKSSFLARPISKWNSLPSNIVESESSIAFKKYIKQ